MLTKAQNFEGESLVARHSPPRVILQLIEELHRLPGIGPRTAERTAFYLLRAPQGQVERLASLLSDLRQQVTTCSVCCNIAEQNPCSVCSDPSRDHGTICVVEEPLDQVAIERTREYTGVYHVLQGAISPVEGIGPEDLRIGELFGRIHSGGASEVILATNPNLEGEATATYLARLVKPMGLTVTRLASGLPVGGDLEYADEVTLGRALAGRREM